MKTFMKKIMVALMFGGMLLSSTSTAQAAWNTYPSDCPLPLTIGNYTTGDGIQNGSNGCWTKTSIQAQPGQVINIAVFYDNTNNSHAGNTTIRLTQSPSGSMTQAYGTYTFSGTLSSSAGNLNLSQVTANLTSAQTLTFGQAAWFRNGSSTGVSLPSGQTGYEAFSGGLSLGTINKGDWGTVLFSFTVGTNGNNNNNNTYCDPTISANQTQVTIGQPVTISWYANDCLSASVFGPGLSNGNRSGSQTVYPTIGSNTYTITGYSSNGSTRTDSVTVTAVGSYQPPVQNSCAVTTVATNVGSNQVTLNGMVSNTQGYGTGASYFEYGTSVALGMRTQARYVNGVSAFSETVSNLSSNTIYFFRLVTECNGVASFGATEIFRTQGTGVVRQTVVQGTTVVGTASPIMLKIENRYQFIGAGDTVDYAVTYRNIGKSTLTRPVLQVVVPKGITITNASRGTYVHDTRTLTAPLEDLAPGAGGIVYLQGYVDSVPSDTAQIVSTAILVYTNPNGAQENAIAYVLNSPKDGTSLLGAAALFGSFGSLGLIGWLLLIIIIMILIILSRKAFEKKEEKDSHSVPPVHHY
jgi:uncharacterized repeat protein (TIGR01451 family)